MRRRRCILKNIAPALLAAAALAGLAAGARGEAVVATPIAATTPSPSPSQADADLLQLPAYPLARGEPSPAASAEPQAESSPAPIQVGDRVVLRTGAIPLPNPGLGSSLTLALPKGSSALSEQGWEVLPPAAVPEGASGEAARLELTVIPLKPGNLTLPLLEVVAGGKAIGRTDPWPAQVVSAIRKDDPKPQEPAPPRPPAELAFPWWGVALVIALALAVAATLGFFVYRWLMDRRRATRAPRPLPGKSAEEEALDALASLGRKAPSGPKELKAHYHGVSEILKRYLGRRYGFSAPESTTDELLATLDRLWNDPKVGRSGGGDPGLRGLFERLDRVKFTDHEPTSGEALDVVEEARKVVQTCRPRPAPESLLPPELAKSAPREGG